MKIRLGIDGGRKSIMEAADSVGAPLLVSANSMWNHARKKFTGWKCYAGRDVALDSGGFIAMKLYGGYRWPIADYVRLAGAMLPTWYAQMDYCCEPEIAANASEVRERIRRTAESLVESERIARGEGVADPMPVLQGWKPRDYCSGPIYDRATIPDLVGVGSVCRRNVGGADGVIAVVEALNEALPANVKLHLFGVKSLALQKLVEYFPERIASVDSMAWNLGGKWEAHNNGTPWRAKEKAEAARGWFLRQTDRLNFDRSQMNLFQ